MKKALLLFVALVTALGVAVSASSTTASKKVMFGPPVHFPVCGPTCGDGGGDGVHCDNHHSIAEGLYRTYTGYDKFTGIPGIGGSLTMNVELTNSTYDHLTSHGVAIAAWTGVNGTAGEWIQAGLDITSNGSVRRYVEWNPDGTLAHDHNIDVGAASFGTAYAVTITHVSNGVWKGSVGGSSWVTSDVMPGTMNQITTTTESQDKSPYTDCNAVDAIFTTMNPARNTMQIASEAPDFNENIGAANFEGVQVQQGS
jgi:hypothetical protein